MLVGGSVKRAGFRTCANEACAREHGEFAKIELSFFCESTKVQFFAYSRTSHAHDSQKSPMQRLRVSEECSCCGNCNIDNKMKVYYGQAILYNTIVAIEL